MKIGENKYLLLFVMATSFLIFSVTNTLNKSNNFLSFKIEEEKKEKPSNGFPDEAMKFYFEQRAYPTGKIPYGWHSKALREMEKNNVLNKTSVLVWSELGPNNIGGRVRVVLPNPQKPDIIYAGAVSGGVWKSTNAGGDWFPLNDEMGNLAVCSLTLDPKHPDTIWAGTGEGFFNYDAIRGEGIFKTTDGGKTWEQLSSTKNVNFYYVNKLEFDSTSSTLWAATRKGLFKSTNGGESFSAVIKGQNKEDVHCTDLEIAYSSPPKIFAALGLFNQSSIYRSTDGGATFEKNYSANGFGRIEIATSSSNYNIVYASLMDLKSHGIGKFIKSQDGGDTWTNVLVPGPAYSGYDNYAGKQGWYNNIIAVNPENANFVLAGGIDLWGSDDGGNSWNQISNWYQVQGYQYIHADIHSIAFQRNNPNVVYLGCDGGIFKSTNGGFNWTAKNNNLNITQFYYGAISPDCKTFYGGTQDNGTLKSSGSLSWSSILGGDGGAVEVDFNNPSTVYLEYVNLAIFKSTNGGTTVSKAMTGIPTGSGFWDGTKDRTLFISPFIMDPNDSQILIAGTYRIWKTTNGGSYWNAISGDLTGDGDGANGAKISALAIAKGNSNVIYAGCSNGVVQVTTDNGTNWVNVSAGLPNLYCTDLAVVENSPNEALASFSGFKNGEKVYRTTDYGASWENISGNFPNIPVNTIFILPTMENIYIAGTDLGVFVSVNGGIEWASMNSGLANVPVFDLDYSPATNTLVAATHGRGMFKSLADPLTNVSHLQSENFSFRLEQNYPNPFGESSNVGTNVTAIPFILNRNGTVKITVYDAIGRKVETLINAFQNKGRHKVYFNARNLSSGVYFYKLQFNGFTDIKKMVLIK